LRYVVISVVSDWIKKLVFSNVVTVLMKSVGSE